MSLLCCRRSILWSSRAARQSKGIRRRSFPNNISLRLAHTRAYFNILRALCASAWAPIEKSRTEPTEPRRYHPAAGVSRRGAESAEKIISVSPWPPCEAPSSPRESLISSAPSAPLRKSLAQSPRSHGDTIRPHKSHAEAQRAQRKISVSPCPPCEAPVPARENLSYPPRPLRLCVKVSHRVHGATEIPSGRRKSHAEAQRAQRKISVSPWPPCEAPFQPERIPHILRALCASA